MKPKEPGAIGMASRGETDSRGDTFYPGPSRIHLSAFPPKERWNDWKGAGLNVMSAVKRGLFTIHQDLIIKTIGSISTQDAAELTRSLREWLGL